MHSIRLSVLAGLVMTSRQSSQDRGLTCRRQCRLRVPAHALSELEPRRAVKPHGPQPDSGGVDASGSVQIVHFARFAGRIGCIWRGGCSQSVLMGWWPEGTHWPALIAVKGATLLSMAIQVEYVDPEQLWRETVEAKERARRADEEALRSGSKTVAQLKQETEGFAFSPDRARIDLKSARRLS